MNLDLMKHLMRLPQSQLHKILIKYLKNNYQNVIEEENKFIIAKGNIPIAVVAHLDTVHKIAPREFFYDQKEKVLWSPQGLGADDRAGVYAIIQIIEAGYRPHVIFCHDEEKGGLGATALINKYNQHPFDDLKCIIELDRSGPNDCVFYECDNEDFTRYIENFGFKTEEGTFSDISIIAPMWEVAAVNLSVGYYYEHSYSEYLRIKELDKTIEKVKKILDKGNKMLNYSYVPRIYTNYQDTSCFFCKKPIKKGKGLHFLYNSDTGFAYSYDCCKTCYELYY